MNAVSQMLLRKVHLVLNDVVCPPGGSLPVDGRAGEMTDLRLRQVGAAISRLAKPEAEIGVFKLEAVLVVEEADLLDGGHAYERAC